MCVYVLFCIVSGFAHFLLSLEGKIEKVPRDVQMGKFWKSQQIYLKHFGGFPFQHTLKMYSYLPE